MAFPSKVAKNLLITYDMLAMRSLEGETRVRPWWFVVINIYKKGEFL